MAANLPDAGRIEAWQLLRRAHEQVVRSVDADLVRNRQRPLAEFDLLAALAGRGGRALMGTIAADMGLSKSNLTRLTDRVEDDGLVERERDTADGRLVHLRLTSTGREEYRRVLPAFQRSLRDQFAARLTESDVVALARALGKLTDDAL
jgi:DNA-binding MarR family transcriptional regulator